MAIDKVLPEELMNSVLGKLYDLLTNGDHTIPNLKITIWPGYL